MEEKVKKLIIDECTQKKEINKYVKKDTDNAK
jgi:hypothetical protein